jgi:hypothetical protein
LQTEVHGTEVHSATSRQGARLPQMRGEDAVFMLRGRKARLRASRLRMQEMPEHAEFCHPNVGPLGSLTKFDPYQKPFGQARVVLFIPSGRPNPAEVGGTFRLLGTPSPVSKKGSPLVGDLFSFREQARSPTSFSCCSDAQPAHRPAATDRLRSVNIDAGFRWLGT